MSFAQLVCEAFAILQRKPSALIYHPHIWSQIGEDFADRLRAVGYNCLSVSLNPGYDDQPTFYPLDQPLMERLDWIDLCIGNSMPYWLTWGEGPLAKIKTLDIDRTARWFVRDYSPYLLFFLLTHGTHLVRPLDATLAQKGTAIRLELPAFMKVPRDAVGPRRKTYILPLAPSKYERIHALRAALAPHEIDHILVCATRSDLAGYWVPTHGRLLIEELLRRFPRHKVVFRPRPEDCTRPEVGELVAAFSNHERFIFDDQNDYAPRYARGVLLITERSSTGQTFALATHRPAIFFQPEKLDAQHINIPNLIGTGCFITDSIEQTVELAENFINQSFPFEARLAEIEQKTYAGNHSFTEKFMGYLDDILHDRLNPDWGVIELPESSILGSSPEDYEQAILNFLQ